ncbi:glycosyltransferase [Sinirhodobacter sp. WL0062]|uniref:Glycosyltransferase n=1 Tax=Rhodobacter flavimaris TaxID=2907145 RepID=A0ABS8YYE1_9RHOB|nr:glycosyltransferase [Sinirhodobacter sp. WL0062]MCE5974160.1 glycosyltransferase [Sinirhodobacter sp. WL0062]
MSAPHVAILMAVRNGARHLPAQLDSIAGQEHTNWTLLVSDDGSRDGSSGVISGFALRGHRVICLDGPRQGAGANFLSLVRRMQGHVPAKSWLAFADQDDVWLPDRLARGIAALEGIAGPALYCSRTWITDERLEHRRISLPCQRPLGFRNALVQNVAAGNTILLNPAGARLANAAAPEAARIVMHDWWIYQLLSGAGARMVHDDRPALLYRQHSGNEIGANDGAGAKLHRIGQLFAGHYRQWNSVNVAALNASAHRLTPENRALLSGFTDVRRSPLWRRPGALWRLGLYRQSRASTAALWLAAMLGRL